MRAESEAKAEEAAARGRCLLCLGLVDDLQYHLRKVHSVPKSRLFTIQRLLSLSVANDQLAYTSDSSGQTFSSCHCQTVSSCQPASSCQPMAVVIHASAQTDLSYTHDSGPLSNGCQVSNLGNLQLGDSWSPMDPPPTCPGQMEALRKSTNPEHSSGLQAYEAAAANRPGIPNASAVRVTYWNNDDESRTIRDTEILIERQRREQDQEQVEQSPSESPGSALQTLNRSLPIESMLDAMRPCRVLLVRVEGLFEQSAPPLPRKPRLVRDVRDTCLFRCPYCPSSSLRLSSSSLMYKHLATRHPNLPRHWNAVKRMMTRRVHHVCAVCHKEVHADLNRIRVHARHVHGLGMGEYRSLVAKKIDLPW